MKRKFFKYFALFAAVLTLVGCETADAMTAQEVKSAVFASLGHKVPDEYFSQYSENITRLDALRISFEAMGWGFALKAVDQLAMLPEWPDIEGVSFIAQTMNPRPSQNLLNDFSVKFSEDDLKELLSWLAVCKKHVSWRGAFEKDGMELVMVKLGIGTPGASINGDLKNGKNEPFFAAMLGADMSKLPCCIVPAKLIGTNKKATLDSIAGNTYGAVGGVNGGYFGKEPIGVLRYQGVTDNAKFWPYRSAFGWNNQGEYIFIDGKEVANIASDSSLNKYTELMQAGPLLMKNGNLSPNTEKVHPNVLDKRHPRTFVGTDDKRVFWGVVDGRSSMHSVGVTIAELKKLCSGLLSLKTALNLDGGGSSSLWWYGMTFTRPCSAGEQERPIPYAVIILDSSMKNNNPMLQ